MEHQNNENIYLKLVTNSQNWMEAFRQNIGMLRSYFGWSVRVLADKADVSENTINKIVQGKTNDCDASIVIKLAKAFGVSADELMGAQTIQDETRKVIAMSRALKEHHRKVIRMYAKHQYELHGTNEPNIKYISILMPECRNGHLKTTLVNEKYCVKDLEPSTQRKVGLGIKIPCDHYEPHFLKGEIILLGVDREVENNEMCVISVGGNIYICIKKIQIVDGKKEKNYVAITNKSKIFSYDEVTDRFGYVVGWLEPDETDNPTTTYSWGER